MWIGTDESGRVNCSTELEEYAGGMVEVDAPEGFDPLSQQDWVLADGALVRDGWWSEQMAEQEAEAEAAAERAQTVADGAGAFFADGGKEAMERSIEEAAASGGADPQLQAIARMQVMKMDLTSVTSAECVAFRDYWPEWKPDTQYKQNDPLQWKGVYYRVSQDTTSSSVYPPDTAGESLYYPVTIAPDGVIVYRTCHGAYDMVRAGETRHYPDADGPVYRAKVDTAYDPDTVPGNWELVDGTDTGETTTPEEPTEEPEPEQPETAPEFIQPTGAHDAYGIGDRVTYGGRVYESTIDGNVWAPDAYPQGWRLVDDAGTE